MIIYFLVFLLSFIFSFILTPFVRKFAFKINAIDIPKDERRIHKEPIPRIGGLAILISFIACIFIFSLFQKQIIGISVGAFIIFLGGFLDDLYSLTPKQKILFQIIAALILIAFDVSIKYITIPFDLNESLFIGKFGILLTIIWVVGVTNAMNLIDGLDGLAAGICFISSMFLFFISIISKRYTAIFLTLILAGSSLGFLPYNFNPASIFLGDCGAQLLGFLLSAISIQGAIKSVAFVIIVPILILALPIYDTLFAIIRRKINKRPISEADKGHIHHKLLDMGLSQKQAVLVMYFISFIFGIASVLVMILTPRKSLSVFIIIFSVSLAFAIEFGLLSKE
ncbi:UDP-GlcNAc:undecaprenyl-phosphate GlcNAc-1-phosphate transferase [Caloramator fervidus]|uniref:UDP-GlcNAc:undecaprenyl-phosphate GlcNAc-1-phosphate transferase n=1 Tax=Caloramator fervidus TaxID=29344 RepID=A0A1H5RMM8_9CLOT|nr:MraY family glycosyltransferase [Caloramator fervidus]SEF38988.1 UDP-GlcNAc:undecaprenyl-phosphate GlcNAc-1-phosphate transferase [Caloramator fervidus]